jgi:hypothetical protein
VSEPSTRTCGTLLECVATLGAIGGATEQGLKLFGQKLLDGASLWKELAKRSVLYPGLRTLPEPSGLFPLAEIKQRHHHKVRALRGGIAYLKAETKRRRSRSKS